MPEEFKQAFMPSQAGIKMVVRAGDKTLVPIGDLPSAWDGQKDVEPTDLRMEWQLSNPIGLDVGYGLDKLDLTGRPKPGWQLHFRLGNFF